MLDGVPSTGGYSLLQKSGDAIHLYADVIGVEGQGRGEEMAETRDTCWYESLGDGLVRGRYLPWICVLSATGLLSYRVGLTAAMVLIAASFMLLLVVLAGARWWTCFQESSPQHQKHLISSSARISMRFSTLRTMDPLTVAT